MNLPWSERVPMLSIHPDAADRDDVARMAAELIEANGDLRDARAALAEVTRERDDAREMEERKFQMMRMALMEADELRAERDALREALERKCAAWGMDEVSQAALAVHGQRGEART